MPFHFLNTLPGALLLIVIGVTCLVNIYAHWIDDGLIGRLLYMAAALTCAAGLFSTPQHLEGTLLSLLGAILVRCAVVRAFQVVKYRRHITHAQRKR